MTTVNLLLLSLLILSVVLFLLVRLNKGLARLESRLEASEIPREGLQAVVSKERRGLFNQLESYLYLRDRLDLHQGLPYTRDWSAAPDFLKVIVEHALERKPKTIVECSSGLTTVMLARSCQLNGSGRVYSLENGEEYAKATRGQVERYGLSEQASVLHAPLVEQRVGDETYSWYTLDELPQHSIDMLVIDGPPGFIQEHSRYPAVPLLFEKLADNCTIFLDDAARDEERELVEMWLEAFQGLSHEYLSLERGCSVLTLGKL